jgi:photosystem II stability/assembly factor-like uncharacterized protein
MKLFNSLFLVLLITTSIFAQKKPAENEWLSSDKLSGLKFRSIGPALTSGRVADIAIHPSNTNKWYVAVASGGVWLSENHGTSFKPIFDNYGSYSTACVAIAPSNPNTIWVGTGENNNQRSVAYGDGVYKSLDGGKSFTNMGLKTSEHIGNIIIHPTDENIIWVAAYGPVWSSGGERGVYKSTDGGKTWNRTLFISDETGISEIAIDPVDPNILYAAAHQRRRTEFTYIGGGPESGLYKSTDGGLTWREINAGLPKNEMGRIGIAVSPVDRDYVYAIVEARNDKSGFYRSTNRGESWEKRSKFSTSGNYYQEIMCDPFDKNKVFAMDTWLHHTEDGGLNFKATGEDLKHVDNHSIWINPKDPNHWIVGCDGGIYETYTHAKEWRFYDNLPIIQFYKIASDNATPFYNVYGGTQDNNSMGGPIATTSSVGILNSDWFITNGGDGFESAIDPTDPNIVYAQAQYGWLVRYDKASGEKVGIQPMPLQGEAPYRWNWDAPLLISPHDHKTLYFAANKVFKSENRGDDWKTISPDLSQQIDRNKIPVMGQVWAADAVMKNASTTIYGNIVALDESPKKKGLLYAGTDDGCIQISEDDGKNWSKQITFPGVPANTRVNMLTSSNFDENIVFAVFNNHRAGDFKPYVFKSSNKGKTWTSISANLPERGSVYCIKQDHVNQNLLFVGTEFGAYFTVDGGQKWTKLNGLPTIAIYDLDIQARENDLIAASFGRGIYVLDNYAPLRDLSADLMNKKAHLFPVKTALLFVPTTPFGMKGIGFQGANVYAAENPTFGAEFTFYYKEKNKTLKEIRQEKEKALEKDKKAVSYPTFEELYAEKLDEKAKVVFSISDKDGNELKRIVETAKEGVNRYAWNLRMENTNPIQLKKPKKGIYDDDNEGMLVVPGDYFVEVYLVKNDQLEKLIEKTKFTVQGLNNQTLIANDFEALLEFRKEVSELNRSISGASKLMSETLEKVNYLENVINNYPKTDLNLVKDIRKIKEKLAVSERMLKGDRIASSLEFETSPSILGRLGIVEYQLYENTTNPTNSQRIHLETANQEYKEFRKILDESIVELRMIESKLKEIPVPYTKSGNETWKEE